MRIRAMTFRTPCAWLLAGIVLVGLAGEAAGGEEPFLHESDLFVSGQDGYHTYRIPTMVISKKGTVLVFCEGRKTGISDAGDIDLLLRRSFDGGKSWGKTRLVHEEGGATKITIGNPCPVVDARGTIHLVFCRNNRRAFHMKSTDDGATFSRPVEITATFRAFDLKWDRLGTGPVHGIQTGSGRIILPVWLWDTHQRGERSEVIHSDDSGATWSPGGIVPLKTEKYNECTVLETADGSLLLNLRIEGAKKWNEGIGKRAVARSIDGGQTWTEARLSDELLCPVCQAAMVRLTRAGAHGKNRILFSNPANSSTRDHMTVRLSYDEGRSWPVAKLLHAGPSSYSDLAVTKDMTILCVYEGGRKHRREWLRLARFNLQWLTDGKDRLSR